MHTDTAMIEKDAGRFKCKLCGSCCKSRDVPLTLDDIFRISDFFNMDPDTFFSTYCVEVAMHKDSMALPFLMRDGDSCCFLDDHICRVHFVKPSVCEQMPSATFGSLEYLRAKMPEGCAIQHTVPAYIANDELKRNSYVMAMLVTAMYYSKYGTFKFKLARPFIYRILLFKKNRAQIYRIMGAAVKTN